MSAAAALSSVELADVPKPQNNFSNRVAELLDRIDYRLASSDEDREAIYRLRYEAYLREGAISPRLSEKFSDAYDDKDNAWIFGLYIDDELASSIRIHVTSAEHLDFPSRSVFSDLLEPELRAGKVIVDPTRFVTNKKLSQLYPGLPYVTLRLCWLAAEYFRAEHFLVAIRAEHQAFYRRTFHHRLICDARPYPLLAKPISLMTVDFLTVANRVHQRYPFFRSTYFERRMLFEPHLRIPSVSALRQAAVLRLDNYRAPQ
jgi:N-acyl-L-homoserine lactone synthetase